MRCETCKGPKAEDCVTCADGYVKNGVAGKCYACDEISAEYEKKAVNGICREVCGDGVNLGTVECDDGNQRNGDGCSAQCEIESGYQCTRGAKGKADVCYEDLAPTANLQVTRSNVLVIQFSETVTSLLNCNLCSFLILLS